MAKGRRERRVKLQPKSGEEKHTDTPRPPADSTDDMVSRIDALRGDVRAAREKSAKTAGSSATGSARSADAPVRRPDRGMVVESPVKTGPIGNRPELHPPYPRPERNRHRGVALGALGVLIIIGVVVGLVASSAKTTGPAKSPIAAYLAANLPSGRSLGVVAGSPAAARAVPAGYPKTTVSASNLDTTAGYLQYVVAPDPDSSVPAPVLSWIQAHGRLVATDPGAATLWRIGTGAPTITLAPATTVAPLTTVAPATTVPPVTSPSTLAAPTPPSTTPTTAAPPTTPATTPATTPPTGATPSPTGPGTAATSVTVAAGQSFWSIAQNVVTQHLGHTPTAAQVGAYWAQLVAANAGHLPVPGTPNLIYSGTFLVLPAVG